MEATLPDAANPSAARANLRASNGHRNTPDPPQLSWRGLEAHPQEVAAAAGRLQQNPTRENPKPGGPLPPTQARWRGSKSGLIRATFHQKGDTFDVMRHRKEVKSTNLLGPVPLRRESGQVPA